MEIWLVEGTQVLVQKRSFLKDTNPGKLDVSCAGHVSAGACILESAVRELNEELGLNVDNLGQPLFIAPCVSKGTGPGGAPYVDRELVSVFKKELALTSIDFTIATSEVETLMLMEADTVIASLRNKDDTFISKPHYYIDALADSLLNK